MKKLSDHEILSMYMEMYDAGSRAAYPHLCNDEPAETPVRDAVVGIYKRYTDADR